jgi:hypothetical protein
MYENVERELPAHIFCDPFEKVRAVLHCMSWRRVTCFADPFLKAGHHPAIYVGSDTWIAIFNFRLPIGPSHRQEELTFFPDVQNNLSHNRAPLIAILSPSTIMAI